MSHDESSRILRTCHARMYAKWCMSLMLTLHELRKSEYIPGMNYIQEL